MYLTWYQVVVKTSNIRAADTNANVYIRINGTTGWIEKELNNEEDNFETGRLVVLAIVTTEPALHCAHCFNPAHLQRLISNYPAGYSVSCVTIYKDHFRCVSSIITEKIALLHV